MRKEDKIISFIKRLRRRIWLSTLLKMFFNSLICTGIACFCLVAISHLTPVVYIYRKAVFLVAMLMALGLSVGLIKRPTLFKTAVVGDSLGLQERLVTYLEYKDLDAPVIELFVRETEETLENSSYLDKFKLNISGKKVLCAFVLIVGAAGLSFLPSTKRDVALHSQEINQKIKEEAQIITAKTEELGQEEELPPEQRQKMLSTLEKLSKELNRSFAYQEAAAHVAQAQQQLALLNEHHRQDGLESLQGILSGLSPNHPVLQQAELEGSREDLLQALEQENFSSEEQKAMLENIAEMQREYSAGDDTLEKIKDSLQEKNLTGKELVEALKKERQDVASCRNIAETEITLQQMKERLLARDNKGFKSLGGEDKAADFAKGEIEKAGNGELTAERSEEIALGQYGTKHMRSSSGIGGGGPLNSQEGSEESREGEIEKKAVGTRLSSEESQTSYVQGQWQEQGKIQNKYSPDALEIEGENKALAAMYGGFRREGMEYVAKQEIPLARKQLVLDYYLKLSGGQNDAGASD